MSRKGYLEKGKDSDRAGRGAEPFVPVDWDSALDMVADELARVREAHGNTSIFAGSYGWASAGRLHHARTLLHRFLNGFGGFTGQVTNYSYAAGMIVMPHVVGTHRVVSGPLTDWRSITENTKLMVMFGGVPVKNAQIESGGSGEHTTQPWLRRAREAGVEFVSISPLRQRRAGLYRGRMAGPGARQRHRRHDGPCPYAGVGRAARHRLSWSATRPASSRSGPI